MASYESHLFDPPAPVATVSISCAESATVRPGVLLLIDSGADITLLPRLAVDGLGVSLSEEKYELKAFDGGRSFASAVTLDLHFLKRRVRGRYLLTDDPIGILGRDVLNHFVLILDGIRQEWLEQSR